MLEHAGEPLLTNYILRRNIACIGCPTEKVIEQITANDFGDFQRMFS